jgi:methyltransferase-like protein
MVRQMMRYHAAQFSEVGAQVEQARALLSFLASATKDTGPYHDVLAGEAERLSRSPDSYVFHEHLERTNIPLYFHEFVARAGSAGLQYLSESIVSEMLTSTFSPDVARTLQRISPDLLHLEQYMDFVRNRQFRQTLLCHANLSPQRALTPEVLSGLLLSSAAVADTSVDLTTGVPVTFSSGTRRARVTSPGSKAALHLLMERWPCGVSADDLFEMALQRAAPYLDVASAGDMEAAMTEDLFGAVMHGLIEVRTQPPPCTNQPSNTPRAHPLAAFQAERGPLVVNGHHAMHDLDPLTRDVLTLANGHRTRDEMVRTLGNRLDGGRATLDAAITALTRRALFVG